MPDSKPTKAVKAWLKKLESAITEKDIDFFIGKRIIEAHNGTVKIHSRKDFGTKIAITIPVQ